MYPEALERKLGPIYGAIETQNYKSGAKLAEALLRKYPKSQLVLTLKAYCAAKLNKREVAEAVLKSVVEEGPQDDRVLHTMMFVYRALDQKEGILDAYVAAVEKRPNDPGIRVGLFGCYVRNLDYIHQQQESFKLAKLDAPNADTYVWWSICSLLMQSQNAVNKLQSFDDAVVQRLLTLAYSMIEQRRLKSNGGKLSFEKFLILCDVLCGLGKHAEALDLAQAFDSVCEDKIPDSEKSMLIGTMYLRLGEFSAASRVFGDAALEDPQNWLCWHLFIASTFPELALDELERYNGFYFPLYRIDGGIAEVWDSLHMLKVWQSVAADMDASFDDRMSHVMSRMDAMRARFGDAIKMKRSIILAGLEVQKYISLHDGTFESMMPAMLNAIQGLAHSSSLAADLRNYLRHLDSQQREYIVKEGMKHCRDVYKQAKGDSSNVSLQDEQEAFMCLVNGYLLESEAGYEIQESWSDMLHHALHMMKLYFENEHLCSSFDPKDRGLGEELLVLAIVPLLCSMALVQDQPMDGQGMEEFREHPWHLLVLALLCIECAQVERKVSAPLRLAASALYGLLGAASLSSEQFATLDIKGVLHDSMTGHWMIPIIMASCPDESGHCKWFDGIENLHTVQEMEAREALYSAYEQATLSKVPEFVDFINRLDKSATYHLYKSETTIMQCRLSCLSRESPEKIHAENDLLESEDLVHNHDFTVRPIWYPPCALGPACSTISWWNNGVDNIPVGGRSGAWWSYQSNAKGVSDSRASWENTVSNQIIQRANFPRILSHACERQPNSESQNEVYIWLRQAFEGLGLNADSLDSDALWPLNMMTAIAHRVEIETSMPKVPEFVSTAIILLMYQVHQTMAEGTHQGNVLMSNVLRQLENIASKSIEHCISLLNGVRSDSGAVSSCFPGNAGVALLSRLVSEEYVWLAYTLHHLLKNSNADGPWSTLGFMRDDLKKCVAAVLNGTDTLLDTVTAVVELDVRTYITEEYQGTLESFTDIIGIDKMNHFDGSACLQNLANAQIDTFRRISFSLQHLKDSLKICEIL
ncbi:N-terminal acetyltransferase B complex auxiliary subunit NAA25 [Picochlorum sp. SENEW3]|nr:N-terminal acetyltransferase B complex auxiliary subunit NAA25 [Picochlorum sp. SENEW3]WPT14662.1 N-terminal acetyltransferase B complex auxiliary subunit NAA25 [Picochlorum sp. SENEW3]